jgi:phosphatidylserine/phosphatidylglycerophosphate/cardiolipin synthase-like enzyme
MGKNIEAGRGGRQGRRDRRISQFRHGCAVAGTVSRLALTAGIFLVSLAPCAADPAPVIHYAPGENLEHVDLALIDGARYEIDMAAYVLTDWPIMQALTRAADRGVKVRIYLDGAQLAERAPTAVFQDLAATPGVEIRFKQPGAPLMHLKSYQIDGHLLRTGAANFSASGEKRQDNDLIVIESVEAAAGFKRVFDVRYSGGEVLSLGAK